jgi:hypothetical protein
MSIDLLDPKDVRRELALRRHYSVRLLPSSLFPQLALVAPKAGAPWTMHPMPDGSITYVDRQHERHVLWRLGWC